MGGQNEREGRVQVCMGGTWGTVCDSGSDWDTTQASVVCQSLGFSGDGEKAKLSHQIENTVY